LLSAIGARADTPVHWDAYNIGLSTAWFEYFGGGIDMVITVPPGGHTLITNVPGNALSGPVQSRWACAQNLLVGAPQNQHQLTGIDVQTALCGPPNTNCVVTFTLSNVSPYDQMFSLRKNGVDTGQFFLIYAGQSTRVQYADPMCDTNGYSIRQMAYSER